VLSWTCRRFRARFIPGSAHAHRRACRECEAFAAAVEQAAGMRLPLPAGLRRGLSAIAAPAPQEEDGVLPFPVPRLPLPDALAARLRAVRPAPPEWLRSPLYAVAASTLLALLLGPFLAAAANRGLAAVGTAGNEVRPLVQRTGESGRAELGKLQTSAAAACREARRSALESLTRLDAHASSLAAWLSAVVSEKSTNRDPRGDAAGSVRRSR
jgi:hypothetical protein